MDLGEENSHLGHNLPNRVMFCDKQLTIQKFTKQRRLLSLSWKKVNTDPNYNKTTTNNNETTIKKNKQQNKKANKTATKPKQQTTTKQKTTKNNETTTKQQQ